jgi:glycosyltransferase involved in cell wall biosynthesis
MGSTRLTIAIPSYNRASYLDQNLSRILPQVASRNDVELVVIDNHSSDGTREVIKKYSSVITKSVLLEKNEGMAVSQFCAFHHASGDFLWILSDDDFVEENAIKCILNILSDDADIYAFNYFARYPSRSPFLVGPEEPRVFKDASALMCHPSVGHMSALIYNTKEAKKKSKLILQRAPAVYFNNVRGIFAHVASALAFETTKTAIYVPTPLFSAEVQRSLDYNGLYHLCYEYFREYSLLYRDGLIGEPEFNYRYWLVRKRLFRSYVRWYPVIDKEEQMIVDGLLMEVFQSDWRLAFLQTLYKGNFILRIAKWTMNRL